MAEYMYTPITNDAAVGANAGVGPEPAFDPAQHLAYEAPSERFTMHQLGLGDVPTPSYVGVTTPFPLATFEGVKALRNSILQPQVLQKHMMASELAGPHAQLRGMAPHAAKFLYEFWTHPQTMRSLCEAAGEDLIPVFDLELGHTNIQVPANSTREAYCKTLHPDPYHRSGGRPAASTSTVSDNDTVDAAEDDDTPMVVGFHRDAYPWVAVLMLSDVSDMVGGETALRLGSGELFKARGPNLGSCIMMQGGYINHAALPCRPQGGGVATNNERITMVTSFRKRSAFGWRDISNLINIRTCSNLNELYAQWANARLDIIQEKIDGFKRVLEARRRRQEYETGVLGGLKDPIVTMAELEQLKFEIEDHLKRAIDEMLPYGSTPSRSNARLAIEDSAKPGFGSKL